MKSQLNSKLKQSADSVGPSHRPLREYIKQGKRTITILLDPTILMPEELDRLIAERHGGKDGQ